ncbi:hypothetical protein AVEN_29361-1 [Araneus ventricosus]|uniref:Uncharacterized protein n=1 Tax=Araneus ventricosus TaxID=182803 RepID=A0A4Y2KFN4_ARAVE|nr:hypothetical protein AVEN_29361-1 [Araneus ventricosus]
MVGTSLSKHPRHASGKMFDPQCQDVRFTMHHAHIADPVAFDRNLGPCGREAETFQLDLGCFYFCRENVFPLVTVIAGRTCLYDKIPSDLNR